MRKFNIAILSIVLLLTSVNTAFAGFGGNGRGGSFGTGGFSTSTVSTEVTYQTLSDMVADVNADIALGYYDSVVPFSLAPTLNMSATIGVYSSSDSVPRYVIYVTYQSIRYYFHNYSGGMYYAYAPTSDPNSSQYQLNRIFNTVTNIYSSVTTISSRLIYTINNTTYTAGQMLYNIWAQLGSGGAIYGAIDNVETFLSSINSSLTSVTSSLTSVNSFLTSLVTNTLPSIYVTGWLSYQDGTKYELRPVPYEWATYMISFMNANYAGKRVPYLIQGASTSNPQHNTANSNIRYFSYASVDADNYIRIRTVYDDNTTAGYLYLVSPNHELFTVNFNTGLYGHITTIETTLSNLSGGNDYTSVLNSINTALYGTAQTRAAELIPVGQTALTIAGSASSMLSAFTNSLLPLGVIGLIQTGVGAIDTVMQSADFVTEYSLLRQILATQKVTIGVTEYSTADLLRLISNYTQATRDALRVTIDGTQYSAAQLMSVTAERTNDIYQWLQGADLLNDNLVVTFINTTKDDFNSALLNGNNIVSLFYHAYRNVIPSVGSSDWSDAVDYFDNLMGVS